MTGATGGPPNDPLDEAGWGTREFAALGEIVVNFARLDDLAAFLLESFVADSHVGVVLVSGQALSWKLEKLSAVAQAVPLDPGLRQDMVDWCTAVRAVNELRNQFMHSLFVLEGEDAPLLLKSTTRSGTWKWRGNPLNLDILRDLAHRLNEGALLASQLSDRLAASRKSS